MSSQIRVETSVPGANPAVTNGTPTPPPPAVRAAAAAPAPPPSVHVRAVITWLAIFPLVTAGMLLLGPAIESWHPVLRSLLLTAVVVPLAVYLVVPRMFAAYGKLMGRRAPRTDQRAA